MQITDCSREGRAVIGVVFVSENYEIVSFLEVGVESLSKPFLKLMGFPAGAEVLREVDSGESCVGCWRHWALLQQVRFQVRARKS